MASENKLRVSVFWFRRDLRLHDNAGLYHALKSGLPVLPLFIFDKNILDQLPDNNDPRVTFIHHTLEELNLQLLRFGSSICVKIATPIAAIEELIDEFDVESVFANNDYEPYARKRDDQIARMLATKDIPFRSFKDHLVFEKDEIMKGDGKPYTVFTPYKKVWLNKLNDGHLRPYATGEHMKNLYPDTTLLVPSLQKTGFIKNDTGFPGKEYQQIIDTYSETRDTPSIAGTTRIGVHLRFGTISIREAARQAWRSPDKTWLSELIWRDFYAMILWHFPHIINQSFKPAYDHIHWRNDEQEFEAWCQGRTGYPIVDAGMHELNATGFMHNRLRMIVASFLTKHLLIDWRWGEAYFARKLLDYDQASNVGGWQWAAGSGNDAAPYFRIFNPELQTKKFDPEMKYIRKWAPNVDDPSRYPKPIVEHHFARERALQAFKEAVQR